MTQPGPPPTSLVPDQRAEHAKEHVSTALSTVGMLALPAGVGWGLWPWLGPFTVAVAAVLLLVLVEIGAARRRPPPAPEPPPVAPVKAKPIPGPTDPGNLHGYGPGVSK